MQRIPEIIEHGLDGSVVFNGKRSGWDTVRVHAEGYVCEVTARTPVGEITITLPNPKVPGALPSIEIKEPRRRLGFDSNCILPPVTGTMLPLDRNKL